MSSARIGLQSETQPPQGEKPARILALDYGRARIGVAIAEASGAEARPLATLERVNRNEDLRRLRQLAREFSVRLVVVGLPLRLDGTRGEMAEEAARFGRRIHKQLGLPVELVDERLTSWEAERVLEEQRGRTMRGVHGSKRKKDREKPDVDSMAAALILREYLGRAPRE
ncbi:MAG TPA: Holliday junction resolvase RuvX [Candidatus Acidoferrum sp.]|nr:Holliday junction resolvase RuvX [Candidatus Acidoferrum sp.]